MDRARERNPKDQLASVYGQRRQYRARILHEIRKLGDRAHDSGRVHTRILAQTILVASALDQKLLDVDACPLKESAVFRHLHAQLILK